MTATEREIAQFEHKLAEDIVLDALDSDEELWKSAVQNQLGDNKHAGIMYSPERVWELVQRLAKQHGVTINHHQ